MSFDKRDYLYSDVNEVRLGGVDNDSDEEKESRPLTKDRIPKEWVHELMITLQDMAKEKGIEILDECNYINFAQFTARYAENVWW